MLGDGKFKLEIGMLVLDSSSHSRVHSDISHLIARPTAHAESPEATQATGTPRPHAQALSLFLTSVIIEYAHTDYEICSSIFVGLKCQDDRAGERGARADWAWDFWQHEWTFREDSEVWGMCIFFALDPI